MSNTSWFNKDEFKKNIISNCKSLFRKNIDEADKQQLFQSVAYAVKEIIIDRWIATQKEYAKQDKKTVYYMSMEFLMGRALGNNMINLMAYDEMKEVLEELGMDINVIEDQEPDAALGNGGLGRLAACFLDSLATLEYPAYGCGIRYKYGMFKQEIKDGYQVEVPDNWLKDGNPFEIKRSEYPTVVKFGGYVRSYRDEKTGRDMFVQEDYRAVTAIPYDMYVSGYDSEGVSKLRLWSAQSMSFDMNAFNTGNYANALGANNIAHALTKVLYPNDNHLEGKALRLRQQYFMCAASIGDIVMRHMNTYGTLDNLHEKAAIHINDTHPTLAVPELMRILLDDCGYSWSKAWHIVSNTFAYTNHTVMAEALEKWDEDLMRRILPRIYAIICEINRRYCEGLTNRLGDPARVERMSIIRNRQVRMANLCIDASHSVNGVSKLHSEIIKDSVFHDEYEDKPVKFKNVTNGIAYRRWLLQSNPGLTKLLSETIGTGFKKDASELSRLRMFENDKAVLEGLAKVKKENKERFAKFVLSTTGTKLNTDSIFDVQVKRLHEYKRQQLNALNIIAEYNYLCNNPDADFVPKTYIFASKAAPGYYMAKQIIKMLWCIGEELKRNPKLNEKLSVIFLEDYRVTLSEILMPAAEISEQISLAGTEASGTGNMKLMLNGAITMGTYDGANVEIHEQVGDDNIFIFGMSTPEVNITRANGYKPESIYDSNQVISAAINRMYSGINGAKFDEVANAIRYTDRYMCLADFQSYQDAQAKARTLYKDKEKWNKMSLNNIAGAGIFSADRAVTDYARDIWRLF